MALPDVPPVQEAPLPLSLHPGACGGRDRRPARVFPARAPRPDEAARRRLHQADQDDDRADHLLHRRDRHRQDGRHEAGRQDRRLRRSLYFEVVSTLALIIGLVVVNVLQPGAGHQRRSGDARRQADRRLRRRRRKLGARSTSCSTSSRPRSSTPSPRARSCRCCSFSVLFGLALHRSRRARQPVLRLRRAALARAVRDRRRSSCAWRRIGAFGAMAFTIGKYGLGSLLSLGKLMAALLPHLPALHLRRARAVIARAHGFSLWKFIRYIKRGAADRARHLVVRVGAAAHDGEAGDARLRRSRSSGLVIPTGYSFNLDGTCIYLTMAALFIAQATNTPLTLAQELDAAGRAAADLQGRGGGDRQRLHHAGRDAVGRGSRAGRRARADPRHRPLHVRGARDHQPDRQRGGDAGGRALDRRARFAQLQSQ